MDAAYQIYKNREATEFALKNFFENSNGKIYITVDGGNDFSYLSKMFPDKIIYNYDSERINTVRWGKHGCLKWLHRIYSAC